MLIFGVNKVLKKDIVTCDSFFNNSEAMTDYLLKRNQQFCYTNIPAEEVTAGRRAEHRSLEIPSCIIQQVTVFESKNPELFKEYIYSCSSYLQFDFGHCVNTGKEVDEGLEDLEAFDDEKTEVYREQQVFESVDTPSSGSQGEPLYFV